MENIKYNYYIIFLYQEELYCTQTNPVIVHKPQNGLGRYCILLFLSNPMPYSYICDQLIERVKR